MLRPLATAFLFVLLATLAGCEPGAMADSGLNDEQVAKYRGELLLSEMPQDAQTVIEARDQLKGAEGDDAKVAQEAEPVTVTGVIGSMPNPYTDEAAPDFPWIQGMAAFALVDPTTVAQFAGHQHAEGEQCMFCAAQAKKLADTVATVRLVDAEGKGIEARADQLLGLREGQTVTVTGTGRVELGSLAIDAQGLFVQPDVANLPSGTTVQ